MHAIFQTNRLENCYEIFPIMALCFLREYVMAQKYNLHDLRDLIRWKSNFIGIRPGPVSLYRGCLMRTSSLRLYWCGGGNKKWELTWHWHTMMAILSQKRKQEEINSRYYGNSTFGVAAHYVKRFILMVQGHTVTFHFGFEKT